MNKFLRKNKYLITITLIVIIIIIIFFTYSKNKEYSYKMNIECSKMAPTFIKQQKDNTLADSWNIELLQTKYNTTRNSCFGEFRFWTSSETFFSFSSIYDLTTNKELISDSPFSLLDRKDTNKNGEEIIKEYGKIKNEIFGN